MPRRPQPILKTATRRSSLSSRSPSFPYPSPSTALPFRFSIDTNFSTLSLPSPHVHFPPTPALADTGITHSAVAYDRRPIVVSPSRKLLMLPERGGRSYEADFDPDVVITRTRGLKERRRRQTLATSISSAVTDADGRDESVVHDNDPDSELELGLEQPVSLLLPHCSNLDSAISGSSPSTQSFTTPSSSSPDSTKGVPLLPLRPKPKRRQTGPPNRRFGDSTGWGTFSGMDSLEIDGALGGF